MIGSATSSLHLHAKSYTKEIMANFHFKDGDEQLAKNAKHLDDIATIISKHDGAIVVVAVHNGVYVCQQCGEPFDDTRPDLRGAEMRTTGAHVLLHSKCLNPNPRSFQRIMDSVRGHQVRRFVTKVAKVFKDE